MRIEVKRDLCIGASSCVIVAPGVFELDSELKAVVKDATGADEHTILEAARACPTLAICLYDDDGKQVFPPPVPPTA